MPNNPVDTPETGIEALYLKPGHLIRRAQQIAVAIFLEECGVFDLTPVQYAALMAVRTNPGIDATRVAGLIAFDRATLGDVFDRLESKGWIERLPSTRDRRIKALHMTAAGETQLELCEAAVERVQERILSPLSGDERETMMRLLTKLVTANNEASRAPRRDPGATVAA